VKYHAGSTTGASEITTVVNGQTYGSHQRSTGLTTLINPVAGIEHTGLYVTALMLVTQSVCAVFYGTLYVLMPGIANDLRQRLYLQIANALWQPSSAFTRIATAGLVNQHSVKRSRTTSTPYGQIFFGVYAVVVKHSLVDHMPIYRISEVVGFKISF